MQKNTCWQVKIDVNQPKVKQIFIPIRKNNDIIPNEVPAQVAKNTDETRESSDISKLVDAT